MDIKKAVSILFVLLVVPLSAYAKPELTVTTVAEKEVVQVENGKPIKKRLPASSVDPGQILIFTLNYKNKGDAKATAVNIDNPIPKNTVYITGSGFGKNSKMIFSIDGGKTFKAPSLLTYEEKLPNGKTVKRQASPEQYTHVRWVVNEVLPGHSGSVGFQVKVK